MTQEDGTVKKRQLGDYILTFLIINVFYITILFCCDRFIKSDTGFLSYLKNPKAWSIAYIVVVFFTMKLTNDLEVQKHGDRLDPLWLTIHPMGLVLLPVVFILNFTPWEKELKRPFEETIGDPIIRLMGYGGAIKPFLEKLNLAQVSEEGENNLSQEMEKDIQEKIKKVVSRKLTLDDIDGGDTDKPYKSIWDSAYNENDTNERKAKSLIKFKRYISEFIWITLASLIVSNITMLSLVNA